MTDQHPITPPPELRRQWLDNDHFPMATGTADLLYITRDRLNSVIDQAAQWGADKELEMCIEVLGGQVEWDLLSTCTGWKIFRDQVEQLLRRARRPASDDLKSLALERLHRLIALVPTEGALALAEPIRIALECITDD